MYCSSKSIIIKKINLPRNAAHWIQSAIRKEWIWYIRTAFFSHDFSSCLLNLIEQMKVAKTRPWKLPFCAEQSVSVTSWTRPACVAKVSNNVTSRTFLFFYWERANEHGCIPRSSISKQRKSTSFVQNIHKTIKPSVQHFAFTSTEARWLIRDGDNGGGGGGGEGGGRTKEWRLDRGYRPKKTWETVDRRQNNGSVKAVSPRHCPATSALRNCCFNCRAGQSHKDNVAPLLRNNSKRKKSNFRSPAPPPAHALFWANLRVQLHLPPLDLAWNPVQQTRTCAHFLRFEAIWRLRVPFPFNEARLQMPPLESGCGRGSCFTDVASLVGRLRYSPCHTIAAAGKQWNISLQVGRKSVRTATSTHTAPELCWWFSHWTASYCGNITFTTMTRSDTHETRRSRCACDCKLIDTHDCDCERVLLCPTVVTRRFKVPYA